MSPKHDDAEFQYLNLHNPMLDRWMERAPMKTNVRLYIFDIDGTLADRDTSHLLSGVKEWFRDFVGPARVALVTNQGGVGLRYWMTHDGFGDPTQFPTEEQARVHVETVQNALLPVEARAYICFAYQSKKSGKWGPTPPGFEDDPEWAHDHRKPAPGMIFDAIRDAQVTRAQTVFIGNGDEDQSGATDAGIAYMAADTFFGREP